MKKGLLAGLLVLMITWSHSAWAQQGTPAENEPVAEGPTASGEVGLLSQYVWRGFGLSRDSLVIQPSLTVSYLGFSLNLWGNLDTDVYEGSFEGQAKWTETDMTFGYERAFGPVTLGLGYIYYALDGTEDSKEIYGSLGLDVPLSPTLTVYQEIGAYPGTYITLGISYGVSLPKGMSLDLSAAASYYVSRTDKIVTYDDQLNPTGDRFKNFQDGTIGASLSIPLGRNLTLQPLLAYSFPLGNEADNLLRAGSYGQKSHHLFGGISLGLSF